MTIKRRYMERSKSISRGETRVYTQVKQSEGYIGRKSELVRLAKSILIHDVPQPFRKRPDLFKQATGTIRSLAQAGGEEYDRAMFDLRFAFCPTHPVQNNRKIWYDVEKYRKALTTLGVI